MIREIHIMPEATPIVLQIHNRTITIGKQSERKIITLQRTIHPSDILSSRDDVALHTWGDTAFILKKLTPKKR